MFSWFMGIAAQAKKHKNDGDESCESKSRTTKKGGTEGIPGSLHFLGRKTAKLELGLRRYGWKRGAAVSDSGVVERRVDAGLGVTSYR